MERDRKLTSSVIIDEIANAEIAGKIKEKKNTSDFTNPSRLARFKVGRAMKLKPSIKIVAYLHVIANFWLLTPSPKGNGYV